MKVFTSIILLLISSFSFAQDSIPRVPLVEIFSSSTCGPCRPGNEGVQTAYFDDDSVKGRYVIIKYQMNWPGNGDPYYITEGRGRRNFYSVSGVPDLYINGTTNIFPTRTLTNVELKAEMERYSYLKITPHYTLSDSGKTFNFDVTCEALQELNPPASRLFIAIVEKKTVKNVKSNGETEFKFVFKKMVPSNGDFIIGKWEKGKIHNYQGSYTFPGSYRLPGSANDPIDVSAEHSVENFENLRVLAWVQDLGTKEIFNAAWGFEENDTTHEYHPLNPQNPLSPNYDPNTNPQTNIFQPNLNDQVKLYPNPSSGHVFVELSDENASIQVMDMQGREIEARVLKTNAGFEVILSEQDAGMYIFKIQSTNGLITRSVVLE